MRGSLAALVDSLEEAPKRGVGDQAETARLSKFERGYRSEKPAHRLRPTLTPGLGESKEIRVVRRSIRSVGGQQRGQRGERAQMWNWPESEGSGGGGPGAAPSTRRRCQSSQAS